MSADPFGTATLRAAVLDAWRASPTRLREDANLEEDHARGYYRDRVIVELAQNAADAATRAGIPGRVTFALDTSATPAVLRASNPGAPLDAEGVASLASLRASAKADGGAAVGRFGVGFAAVRSVADDVAIRSTTGGVRFSAALTRAELDAAGLAAGSHVAVLRLPFPERPSGRDARRDTSGDTVVELVLRDADAVAAVRAQLAAVDDALLLALPALERIEIDVDGAERVLADVGERWVVHRAQGHLGAADVADLPAEQRTLAWSVVWALPRDARNRDARNTAPRVLHAPTPTDVPLTFPALLVATFPVDPGRRRVLPGAATDRLAAAAGRAFADLLAGVDEAGVEDALVLVPDGLPAGDLDAAIRAAAIDALAQTPLLGGVAPRDAVLLAGPAGQDEDVAAALGTVPLAPRHHAVARRLGATVVPLADLLDELAGLPPDRWHAVYEALGRHLTDPAVREALAGAPVPLADGRLARGARGLVLPAAGEGAAGRSAGVLGLRVVHPDAAHPVLERVGATSFDPATVLRDPAVRGAALDAAADLLDADADDDATETGAGTDPHARAVVDAVLDLVADTPADAVPFWTGELPVRIADGGFAAVRETALPGTWAAEHLDGLDVVADALFARHAPDTLRAAGAHATLDVYRVPEAVTITRLDGGEPTTWDEDDDPDTPVSWLTAWHDYLAFLADRWGAGVLVTDIEAISDLDAVADDSWPQALALVAGDPTLRRALLTPVRPGPGADPGATPAPSYAAWWLRRTLGRLRGRIRGGVAGGPFALRDGVPLLPPAPAWTAGLDGEVLRALGGVASLADLEPADWSAVLDGLPPVGAPIPVRDALDVWRGLAATALALDPAERATGLDPLPDRIPALHAGRIDVADADAVVVATGHRWAQLGPVLPAAGAAAAALADLLDLPVAAERQAEDDGDGDTLRPLDLRVAGLDDRLPATWHHHDGLRVDGHPVRFWVDDAGVHAVDQDALADALADHLAAPHLAALLRAALHDPARAQGLWAAVGWQEPASR